jgi:hypothetical protein
MAANTIYTLHFEADTNFTSTKDLLIGDFYKSLQTTHRFVQELDKIFSNRIVELFVLPLVHSTDLVQWSTDMYFKTSVYIKVQATGKFNRSSVEDSLYTFPSRFQYAMRDHDVVNLPGKTPSTRLRIIGRKHTSPSIKEEWVYANVSNIDYIRSLNNSFLQTPLKNIYVTSLLFCKQNVYRISDFITDYETLELVLKESNLRFQIGHFILSLNEAVHICQDKGFIC